MGTNQTFNHIAIPIDWEVIKFNELANIVRGSSPRPAGDPKYFNGKYIPWLTVASLTNIPESQVEVLETDSFLTEEGAKQSRILEIGTLILSNSGATLGVAKLLGIKCCANDGIAAFLNWKHQLVNIHYAFYFLNSKTQYFRDVVAPGNGQPNLNTELIGIENIYFPPLPEQKAITSCLSTWDEAIQKTSQLITQKELRKKWLMQQLLTGKKRLKGFSGEWKEHYLGEMFSERNETNYTKLTLLSIGQNGVYPQAESIKKDTSNEDKSKYKRICPNDIGYNTMRMWQGRCALSTFEGIVSPAYTIIIPRENSSSLFFSYLFKTPKLMNLFWRNSQGLVDDTLNCKFRDFAIIKLLLPNIEEQTAIANILQTADKEIELLQTKLLQLKEQKKGLMQMLLTGKKRLKQ